MTQLLSKIFLALAGLILLALLLGALGLYIVWATLRWLLTGRKPQVVLVWQQFRTMRQNFRQEGFRRQTSSSGADPWGRPQATDDQVVDVEMREVEDNAPRLPPH
jgi:hypothetical protein